MLMLKCPRGLLNAHIISSGPREELDEPPSGSESEKSPVAEMLSGSTQRRLYPPKLISSTWHLLHSTLAHGPEPVLVKAVNYSPRTSASISVPQVVSVPESFQEAARSSPSQLQDSMQRNSSSTNKTSRMAFILIWLPKTSTWNLWVNPLKSWWNPSIFPINDVDIVSARHPIHMSIPKSPSIQNIMRFIGISGTLEQSYIIRPLSVCRHLEKLLGEAGMAW